MIRAEKHPVKSLESLPFLRGSVLLCSRLGRAGAALHAPTLLHLSLVSAVPCRDTRRFIFLEEVRHTSVFKASLQRGSLWETIEVILMQ